MQFTSPQIEISPECSGIQMGQTEVTDKILEES